MAVENRGNSILDQTKDRYQISLENILLNKEGGLRNFKTEDELKNVLENELFHGRILPKDDEGVNFKVLSPGVSKGVVKLNGTNKAIDIVYFINLQEKNFPAYFSEVHIKTLN